MVAAGEGQKYIARTGDEGWRFLFADGVSPSEAAFQEHAAVLAED